MDSLRLIFLLLFAVLSEICAIEHLSSKLRAEELEKRRCGYSLTTIWTAELAHAPFASTPLIADVNGDGSLDIVAAPFSESLTVRDAQTGRVLSESRWPALNLDSSIHASPLLFDKDGDGMLDLMFAMSSGELLFYRPDGFQMTNHKYQVPRVYVKRDWYKGMVSVSHQDIHKYVTADQDKAQDDTYVSVDPHILATPSLGDINNDNRVEELVIPICYFYEEDDYRLEKQLSKLKMTNSTELEHYLVSGVVVVNLTSLEIVWSKILDLTQVLAGFPAYNLFTPTIIDLDSVGGELEIVMASSAGTISVFDYQGNSKAGWPVSTNSIHGQITVADVTGDGSLDVIAIDTSSNVLCISKDGRTQWEGEISGTSSPGSRLFDLNNDQALDIIITTNNGNIYGLDGKTGAVLEGWPVRIGQKLHANVLITKLSTVRSAPDMVVTSDDGSIHVISTDLKCKVHFPIGESSMVQILSHDLVLSTEGIELLVATSDGTLLCLGSEVEKEDKFSSVDDDQLKSLSQFSLQADTRTVNDFSFSTSKPAIHINVFSKLEGEVTGGTFSLNYEILDPGFLVGRKDQYRVKVYFGRNLLLQTTHDSPGSYAVTVPVWEEPRHGHMIVMLTNHHGQVFQDSYPLRFNTLVMEDLQWLLLAPFVAMLIILLVIHGFPTKDLLPYTTASKGR